MIQLELSKISKEELIEKYLELEKENERLKKKLRRYENPHTPPSKDERRIKSRSNFKSKTGLPVGKRRGYKGRTREKKKPTDFINCFEGLCVKCGKLNTPNKIKEKIYEEIPKPQPTKVIQARWGYYKCGCGHSWESKHPDIPLIGQVGKNAQTHITLLRFDDRLPLRKTAAALERQFDFKVTSKAVFDITQRVGAKVTPKYKEIQKKIRRAKVLNIDETKIKVQGVWYYVWIFRSSKFIFFTIRRQRNRKVLDEILGYNYKGIIGCDGLSAYKEYTKYLQRCWAHILRETKELAEKYDDAKPMHQWMKDLFAIVKSASIKDPPSKRRKIYDKCVREMTWLIERFSSYNHLTKVITTIKNGLEFRFTRILHPTVEPTNNRAENGLRELVVMKKIMGTLRNEQGAEIFAKIMTLISTWRLQAKSPYAELRALL